MVEVFVGFLHSSQQCNVSLLVAQLLENQRGKMDMSQMDGSDSNVEDTLLERIRSIKHEKSVTTLVYKLLEC